MKILLSFVSLIVLCSSLAHANTCYLEDAFLGDTTIKMASQNGSVQKMGTFSWYTDIYGKLEELTRPCICDLGPSGEEDLIKLRSKFSAGESKNINSYIARILTNVKKCEAWQAARRCGDRK